MSVHTEYDEKRDWLRSELEDCLEYAKDKLFDKNIWGYDDMRSDYAAEVLDAIQKAIDSI